MCRLGWRKLEDLMLRYPTLTGVNAEQQNSSTIGDVPPGYTLTALLASSKSLL
jgi:hypothetical protein